MNLGVVVFAATSAVALGVGFAVLGAHLEALRHGADRRLDGWAAAFAGAVCAAIATYALCTLTPLDVLGPFIARIAAAFGILIVIPAVGVAAAIARRPLPQPWFNATVVAAVLAALADLFVPWVLQDPSVDSRLAFGGQIHHLHNTVWFALIQMPAIACAVVGIAKALPDVARAEKHLLVIAPVLLLIAYVNDVALFWGVIATVPLLPIAYAGAALAVYQIEQSRYRLAVDSLQLMVRERKAELARRNEALDAANERLEDALEDARAGARAKSIFVANMSHELRTPLNGILGLAEVLEDSVRERDQRDLLDDLRGSAQELLATLTDILDQSRLESGTLELADVPFDPVDVVERAVESYASAAARKKLTLTTRCEAGIPQVVRGDPIRLRQVIGQLVDNAVKFTPAGWVTVEVAADGVDGDSGRCRLIVQVHDTGPGIEPAHAESIFEPFRPADAKARNRHSGIGLGLSVARRTLELADGRLDVVTGSGEGACFRLEVPVGVVEAASVRPLPLTERSVAVLAGDEHLSGFLTKLAAAAGAAVVVAPDEAALPTVFRNGAIEIVLLDVSAPPEAVAAVLDARRPLADGRMSLAVVAVAPAGRPLRESVPPGWRPDGVLFRPGRSAPALEMWRGVVAKLAAGIGPVVPALQPPRRGPGTVLIVEDNIVNQRVLGAMVKKLGFETVLCADGRVGADTYIDRDGAFDAVLMDCQMPVLDGFGSSAEIRAWEARTGKRRAPIIAVTANALDGDRDRCLAAGMDDFLAKPVSAADLATVLEPLRPAPAGFSLRG